MSFNQQFIYDHLTNRVRSADQREQGGLLFNMLQFIGETMDEWDDELAEFFLKIEPETAPEEFIDFWLLWLFDWSWFPPEWFTLERKRALFAEFATLLMRRGTARGIRELLRQFSIIARVFVRPLYVGEVVIGDDSWSLSEPLYIVVQVLGVIDEVNFDVQYIGEAIIGEAVAQTTRPTLTFDDIEALLRYEQPHSQVVVVEYKQYAPVATPAIIQ